MQQPRMTVLKYERRGDRVTPVLTQLAYDSGAGRWWVARVSEGAFPVSVEAVNDFQLANEDGYEAAPQCNSRAKLCMWHRGTDQNPVLQPADEWPVLAPYLPLDQEGWRVSGRDHDIWRRGEDWPEMYGNHWVPELFPNEPDVDWRHESWPEEVL